MEQFQLGILGQQFAQPLFLALFAEDEVDRVAVALPAENFFQKDPAGDILGLQPFVSEQARAGRGPVVDKGFRVPGRLLLGRVEEAAGNIEVAEADQPGTAAGEGAGEIGAFRGEGVEQLLQRPRFHQHGGGFRRQVVKQGGLRGAVRAGRRRHGEVCDCLARALGDRVEGAQVLQGVTEEVQPVGLCGGDRVEVDDAAAHGVLPGGLAQRLVVVVVGAEQFKEGGEGLGLTAGEDGFAAREVLHRWHRLEEGGRGGAEQQRAGGGVTALPAQPAEHGEPVAAGVEGFA